MTIFATGLVRSTIYAFAGRGAPGPRTPTPPTPPRHTRLARRGWGGGQPVQGRVAEVPRLTSITVPVVKPGSVTK